MSSSLPRLVWCVGGTGFLLAAAWGLCKPRAHNLSSLPLPQPRGSEASGGLVAFFLCFWDVIDLPLRVGRGTVLLRSLDCDLCPLIWICRSSTNFLDRRSRMVILLDVLLCSS